MSNQNVNTPENSASENRVLRRMEFAHAFEARGDFEDAIEIYKSITEDYPKDPIAWFEYGRALGANGKDAFEKYLELYPRDVRGARLHLANMGILPKPMQPSHAFITALFDGYANRFDHSLIEKLDYRAPQILRQLIGELPIQSALDLGCGTGLMGAELEGAATTLVGVDLSDEMLKIAKSKKIYHALHLAEAGEWIKNCGDHFDLIVAADVFSYFGDLTEILNDGYLRLNAGGRILFTVEAGDDTWALLKSMRFAHGEKYIKTTLENAGFKDIEIFRDHLRMDAGCRIEALYVRAKK